MATTPPPSHTHISPSLHTHTHTHTHTHSHTQTPFSAALPLQIAHTCSWLLAACHPPPALILFPQHRKPSRQASELASSEGLVRQPEHGSAGPVWTEPVQFTLGNSWLQNQQWWPSPFLLVAEHFFNFSPGPWNGSRARFWMDATWLCEWYGSVSLGA